jgi:ATP-binding cassette subfamily B protein
VELHSLRRQIGIVPQDSLLFEGTIQDNISLTNPNAEANAIITAAKIACCHDFIMELPLGYNTRVGERGSTLSGAAAAHRHRPDDSSKSSTADFG